MLAAAAPAASGGIGVKGWAALVLVAGLLLGAVVYVVWGGGEGDGPKSASSANPAKSGANAVQSASVSRVASAASAAVVVATSVQSAVIPVAASAISAAAVPSVTVAATSAAVIATAVRPIASAVAPGPAVTRVVPAAPATTRDRDFQPP
jgi:hypothetical protein